MVIWASGVEVSVNCDVKIRQYLIIGDCQGHYSGTVLVFFTIVHREPDRMRHFSTTIVPDLSSIIFVYVSFIS
jgi:hypothetical protein